jgi:hypothetical protein
MLALQVAVLLLLCLPADDAHDCFRHHWPPTGLYCGCDSPAPHADVSGKGDELCCLCLTSWGRGSICTQGHVCSHAVLSFVRDACCRFVPPPPPQPQPAPVTVLHKQVTPTKKGRPAAANSGNTPAKQSPAAAAAKAGTPSSAGKGRDKDTTDNSTDVAQEQKRGGGSSGVPTAARRSTAAAAADAGGVTTRRRAAAAAYA